MRRMLNSRVRATPLPDHALLQRHRQAGAYTDCYSITVAGQISLETFVESFYTSRLFKLERLILKWAVARPSTDAQARQLGAGTLNQFAAWDVEDRASNQLLLCDLYGKTRSWLMAETLAGGAAPATRLYFGSAVTGRVAPRTGRQQMAPGFRLLLGFHRLYSIALLRAAGRRLNRSAPGAR